MWPGRVRQCPAGSRCAAAGFARRTWNFMDSMLTPMPGTRRLRTACSRDQAGHAAGRHWPFRPSRSTRTTVPTKIRIKGVDVVDVVKRIARDGFVFAVSGKPPDAFAVYRRPSPRRPAGDQTLARERWRRVEHGEAEEKAEAASVQKAGRTLHRLGRDGVWWVEKGELILTGGNKADEIMEVLEGRQPSATRPSRSAPNWSRPRRVSSLLRPGSSTRACSSRFRPSDRPWSWWLKRVELRWGFDAGGSGEHCSRSGSGPSRGCVGATRPADLRDRIRSRRYPPT